MSAGRTGRLRRAARVAGALLAVGILLAPAQAVADSIEPKPTEWPKVEQPTTSGQFLEPQPVDWPGPEQP
ncbi:hypothetical protein [Kribbella sp. NPDC048915]|uniref:hypothetical protein n=1 Tax=Kribbella sp. NPDC048915 TaxID=3155148 RepID=UPI0033EF4F8F